MVSTGNVWRRMEIGYMTSEYTHTIEEVEEGLGIFIDDRGSRLQCIVYLILTPWKRVSEAFLGESHCLNAVLPSGNKKWVVSLPHHSCSPSTQLLAG